jgi:DegV family protein with EDD domain
MTVKILTDSAANCFAPELLGIKHENVPLTIQIDGQSWLDDGQIKISELIQQLKTAQGPSTSSCPNLNAWLKAFEGADIIYVLTITSGLSGSYSAAMQAKRLFQEEHPEVKIHVFDSKSAGPQIRLLATDLALMVKHGLGFDQVVETMKYKLPQTDLLFVLENLDNLAKNGRVNPAVARVSQLLKINIYGTASKAGKFEMLGKTRAGKKLLPKLVKIMETNGYAGGNVYIDHVEATEKAEKLKACILAKYPEAEVSIAECGGICAYYAEEAGLMIGYNRD